MIIMNAVLGFDKGLLVLFGFFVVTSETTNGTLNTATSSFIMDISATSGMQSIATSVEKIPPVTTNLVPVLIKANSTPVTTEIIPANRTATTQNISTAAVPVQILEGAIVGLIDKCPELETVPDLDSLTQDEFITKLTDSCRYDKLIKPPSNEPLYVTFQIDMIHIESADHLQLKAHVLVQLVYTDTRLSYANLSPQRRDILGEENLRNKIWVPHIIVTNERESSLMGLDGKDVFVQIDPDGVVICSYRMTTMFYCWMNLKKFPFDAQVCEIKWVSWAYNVTNLMLRWEESRPFQVAPNLHLTEFVLEEKWCETSVVPPSFERGGLVGNYSAVTFKFRLRREVGFYIMDYFLPSILLVCMSWVTFWLQADASAPRVTLGTATMLSFVTLNGGLSKNLPKVSYIKASEIWFLGCTSFIFFSLAEFAFVNVIWRRRKKVELKKQNSKHILKGALTPSLARKQLRKAESINNLYKTRSCSSLDKEQCTRNTQANYLTVHSFPSSMNVPVITTESQDDLICNDSSITRIPIPDYNSAPPASPPWTTMTPQEVAIWIDNKSRIVFPAAFLIFNLFYWSFVYAL